MPGKSFPGTYFSVKLTVKWYTIPIVEKKKNIVNNLIGIVLMVIAGWAAVTIARAATGGDVWYDELFSVKLGKMTYGKIAQFTAYDVHPPMYYWYIKTMDCLTHAANYIAMCKIASFIPYIAMAIMAVTIIRKRWGLLTAGLFLLLITIMPNMATYYVEIRMYSFAMPFLLLQGIMLTDMLSSERNAKYKWAVFFVCSLIIAYTQYFALIASGGMYILLFALSFRDKERGHRQRLGFFGMVLTAFVLYLPWLPSFFKQINGVVGSYWIQPMGLRSLPGCLKYIFLANASKTGYILAAALILIIAIAYVMNVAKKDDEEYALWLAGPSALICMIVLAYVFSIMGRPIFVYRYMVVVLPILYLGVAYVLARRHMAIMAVGLVLILMTGNKCIGAFNYEESTKVDQYAHAKELLEGIEKGSMIVTNFEQVTAVSAYYLPDCDAYIYGDFVVDPLLTKLFEDNTYELHGEDIAPYIEDKYDNVYYFGTGHERDGYVADWEEQGIKVTLIDECLIERYWINIYKLELE